MSCLLFLFFHDTTSTEIYTLSLHDALPIFLPSCRKKMRCPIPHNGAVLKSLGPAFPWMMPSAKPLRSEEHTSELQSRQYLVCRLLLEKKKYKMKLVASKTRTSMRRGLVLAK